MTGNPLLDLAVLPIAFGLIGFIEPCSLGSTLIFIKVIEGKRAATRIAQTFAFAAGRAAFIGLLGAIAVLVGTAFFGFQKAAWGILGLLYAALGIAYLTGRIGWFMRSFGPSLARISSTGTRCDGLPRRCRDDNPTLFFSPAARDLRARSTGCCRP